MHQIDYLTFEESKTRQEIVDKCNARAENNSDSGSGLYYGIKFIDRVFDTYEDAESYIEEIDNDTYSRYNNYAVKYKQATSTPNTKAYENAKAKSISAFNEYRKASNKVHYKGIKSQFVACKKCGSKLSTTYIDTNKCPLCNTELRPQSTLDAIDRLRKAYEDAQKKIEVLEKEWTQKHNKVKWLVKIEYHV